MFGLSALATKAIAGAVIAAALAGSWFALKTHYVNQGRLAHALEVEMQDARAVEAGTLARQTVAKCRDSGGEWDVSSGKCVPR